jgi:hypothetical protein
VIPECVDSESRENTGRDKIAQVSKLDVSVSCGELWWPRVLARDDGGRGEKMRREGAIYISIGDHIPLHLGQGYPRLVQIAMPVEQLADRVILKHPKVIPSQPIVCMTFEPSRRVLPWMSSITVQP